MTSLALMGSNPNVVALLLVAGAWYVSSRLLVEAFTDGERNPDPLRRAFGHWLPVLIVGVIAAARQQPGVALGVALAASVACLSLALGVVTLTAPSSITIPPEARRGWSLALPAAVILWLMGLRSQLTWQHALMLAGEGVVLLLALGGGGGARASRDIAGYATSPQPRAMSPEASVIQAIIGFILAIVGGWFAVGASARLGAEWDLATNGLVASMLLGPALIVPMVGSGTLLGQRGDYAAVVTSSVVFVLLNLCVLLPIIVGVSYLWPAVAGLTTRTGGAGAAPLFGDGIVYPLQMWRVDAVMLMVLSLALLPMSLGRWTQSRLEGVGLIIAYAVYLGMSATAYKYRW